MEAPPPDMPSGPVPQATAAPAAPQINVGFLKRFLPSMGGGSRLEDPRFAPMVKRLKSAGLKDEQIEEVLAEAEKEGFAKTEGEFMSQVDPIKDAGEKSGSDVDRLFDTGSEGNLIERVLKNLEGMPEDTISGPMAAGREAVMDAGSGVLDAGKEALDYYGGAVGRVMDRVGQMPNGLDVLSGASQPGANVPGANAATDPRFVSDPQTPIGVAGGPAPAGPVPTATAAPAGAPPGLAQIAEATNIAPRPAPVPAQPIPGVGPSSSNSLGAALSNSMPPIDVNGEPVDEGGFMENIDPSVWQALIKAGAAMMEYGNRPGANFLATVGHGVGQGMESYEKADIRKTRKDERQKDRDHRSQERQKDRMDRAKDREIRRMELEDLRAGREIDNETKRRRLKIIDVQYEAAKKALDNDPVQSVQKSGGDLILIHKSGAQTKTGLQYDLIEFDDKVKIAESMATVKVTDPATLETTTVVDPSKFRAAIQEIDRLAAEQQGRGTGSTSGEMKPGTVVESGGKRYKIGADGDTLIPLK